MQFGSCVLHISLNFPLNVTATAIRLQPVAVQTP